MREEAALVASQHQEARTAFAPNAVESCKIMKSCQILLPKRTQLASRMPVKSCLIGSNNNKKRPRSCPASCRQQEGNHERSNTKFDSLCAGQR